MKKRKKGRTLSRTSDQLLALKRTMATSLILHKKVQTTLAKAKEVRPFVERMITRAKKTTAQSKDPAVLRLLRKDLCPKAVFELVEIVQKYSSREGGYTRIVKLAPRKSDSSKMAIIELVGFEAQKEKKKETGNKKEKPAKGEKISKSGSQTGIFKGQVKNKDDTVVESPNKESGEREGKKDPLSGDKKGKEKE